MIATSIANNRLRIVQLSHWSRCPPAGWKCMWTSSPDYFQGQTRYEQWEIPLEFYPISSRHTSYRQLGGRMCCCCFERELIKVGNFSCSLACEFVLFLALQHPTVHCQLSYKYSLSFLILCSSFIEFPLVS